MPTARRLALGLISGTSQDGIDAALCAFDAAGRWSGLLATASGQYPPALAERLLDLGFENRALTLADYARCDRGVAEAFADTARLLLDGAGLDAAHVEVIGSHGQTVFHDAGGIGNTLQLGDPSRIAARLDRPVVADFRRADLALGGQGAPLVPAFHHALFAVADEARAVLNLGGIANLTLLPGADPAGVRGFDTGPANGLMDAWCRLHRGQPYDADGAWAASGQTDPALLQAWLAEPWFDRDPPKSTGRGQFNLDWARARAPAMAQRPAADVQRSLLDLTVETVARALLRTQPQTRRLLVCGGGACNGALMRALTQRLPAVAVAPTSGFGLDPAWVEAAAFAWLALARLDGRPGALPAVTGARRPALLGGVFLPAPAQ